MTDHVVDEVDVLELFDDLKNQWRWLLGGVLVASTLAILYVRIVQPVYQVESVFKEVSEAELMQLNQPKLLSVLVGAKEDVYISSIDAFKIARTVLRSNQTLQLFYDHLIEIGRQDTIRVIMNNGLSREQNFLNFVEQFNFIDPGAKETDRYLKITFECSNAELAAQILNDYVSFALSLQLQTAKKIGC